MMKKSTIKLHVIRLWFPNPARKGGKNNLIHSRNAYRLKKGTNLVYDYVDKV